MTSFTQQNIDFSHARKKFDLLTPLAERFPEILDTIVGYTIGSHAIKMTLVIGDETGWSKNMKFAMECPGGDEEFERPMWFTGVPAGGFFYLTEPPLCDPVQLTAQNRLSINTFGEVDPNGSDAQRLKDSYFALCARKSVLIRKGDNSLLLSLSGRQMTAVLNAASEEATNLNWTPDDVRDCIYKTAMPVPDARIDDSQSAKSCINIAFLSKAVTLKTTRDTWGRIPIAFRLDAPGFTTTADVGSCNRWAMLVPWMWTQQPNAVVTELNRITGAPKERDFKFSFEHTLSAVIKTLILDSCANVPHSICDPNLLRNGDKWLIYDESIVRRTPEGGRIMRARLRASAPSAQVFQLMAAYA